MNVTTRARDDAHEGQRVRTRIAPAFARPVSLHPRRRMVGYAVAVGGNLLLTVALLPLRSDITPLSKGFGFLVVVVVSAAVGGLGPGVLASVIGFLLFNFFFIPPYGTFAIGRGEYVVVLFVFLGLSILISSLLSRATERAEAAEARESEVRALQALSAELVALVPGPRSYGPVLARILDLFGFSSGALLVQDTETRELREQVTVGEAAGEPGFDAKALHEGRSPERLPLSVGGRVLGLVVLRGDRHPLTAAESRVLRAFCDQFALVLERDRLLRAATEAEVFKQTETVRRSLLAAVSHDLRSPLAAIKASVTDLLEEDASREPGYFREALQSVDEETDRLASLIANLLDMSRIEGGMLKARVQSVDLPEILSTCVDRVRRQWPRLDIDLSLSDESSVVRADPVFLDRVCTNLFENAAKATVDADLGRVEVEARAGDGRAIVRVIDHGRGVPPEVREQLFYPFYQVTERHPRLGTGLGLAISKGFLALMDGEIWIEDTPGGGATFAFSLPRGPTS